MTADMSWVALGPTIDPIKNWLREQTGQTVSFGQAPSGGRPPFTVLSIVSDPRLILTLDGGQPVEVNWQLDHMGENPLQALGLFDKGHDAMVHIVELPTLPGATIDMRESVGDMHGPAKVSDGRFNVQAQYRWRLIPAVS